MKLTKTLGYLGLVALLFVGLGEYSLHYSPEILGNYDNYGVFKFVSLDNLTTGHFLTVIGLLLYFVIYIHIYRILKSENESLAKIVVAIHFVTSTIDYIWKRSYISTGNIVHLRNNIDITFFQIFPNHYTNHRGHVQN